ncbi:hypothetical protein K503DRAFT_719148 [Rhizopogon vinicolor AM-OR11-026]|uniref:Uncharacterized protein n=1 Tax=Rhizopogon vinicolor AM-OR11-026 TaxID=1314800 RepID=A0A1B7MZ28_9AGAM|nr:hypothetical protein K503DRAFT_857089 [Rhizopogon vinicolor AM-OR11-026]OAX37857.1 hypothetical protein K503DRAFT_719148 [Rhizopogon vinicolor AM-OR11-026]
MKQLHAGPRFNRPAPSSSIWKRISLLLVIVSILWAAFQLKDQRSQPKTIHADRYSKEFKYRPAASPIITERLKDGVVRLRGAYPST